ncbi:MAG: hypothetical protein JW801_09880 [Bacteroidales bacterium]|nr:hypothetical protein [Bacteroidales bacterium]
MHKEKVHFEKRKLKRYHIPVIGHFANKSIRFNSILEAEEITGISYSLIFEACIGKIYKARNVYWEFENGTHYLKYKSHYLRAKMKLEEESTLSPKEQRALKKQKKLQQSN